jgi:hypothetical protein
MYDITEGRKKENPIALGAIGSAYVVGFSTGVDHQRCKYT